MWGRLHTVYPVDSPPTTPPPTSVVVHDDAFPVGSKVLVPDTFSTSATGTLVVTLDWTFASNDIDIFVARGTEPCTLQTFNNRTCPFIATEESATLKPEKLTIPNLPAGAYTLYVANFGATDESVACHIVLTSATSASISSVPVGRGASDQGRRRPAAHSVRALRLPDDAASGAGARPSGDGCPRRRRRGGRGPRSCEFARER